VGPDLGFSPFGTTLLVEAPDLLKMAVDGCFGFKQTVGRPASLGLAHLGLRFTGLLINSA